MFLNAAMECSDMEVLMLAYSRVNHGTDEFQWIYSRSAVYQ